MDCVVIRIHIPKIELEDAVAVKLAVEKITEDIPDVEVELSAFTVKD